MRNVLKPTLLFAAGSVAGTAQAATPVDISPSAGGTPINLISGSPAQFRFTDEEGGGKIRSNNVGVNYISSTPSPTAVFPANGDATLGESAKTANAGDGYYGIRFTEADSTQYAGYLLVDQGGVHISEYDFQVSAGPEPDAWALMIVGFGGVGMALRRRRRAGLPAAA